MKSRTNRAMLKRVIASLDEGQKRWFAGREALLLGRGGIRQICQASGLSKPTVLRGIKELQSGKALRCNERVRQSGGGRKKAEDKDQPLSRIWSASWMRPPLEIPGRF